MTADATRRDWLSSRLTILMCDLYYARRWRALYDAGRDGRGRFTPAERAIAA